MYSEALQFLFSTALTAALFVPIWLLTRLYKPKILKVEFAAPWKEGALAIGYVVGLFVMIGVAFFLLEQSAGVPIGTSGRFDLRRALSQWGVYAAISFVPIFVILKMRKQGFETVGVTRKNIGLSLLLGVVLSLLYIFFSTTPEYLPDRLLTYNTLYAFIYYSAVGLGEELMFRGFLQLRCTTWLGEINGLIVASVIMALIHIPQRIFAVGLDPLQALVSAVSLTPFSLLMGFLMLRTKNISGPAIMHTIANWTYVLQP